MVCGLGAAWILDGLQITIASSVTGVLTQPSTLDMTSTEVGLMASVYLVGELIGALVFGRLSDKLGRKRLLITTLSCTCSARAWRPSSPAITPAGWCSSMRPVSWRGWASEAQYAAINSAIDEMMPSKYRGRVDIWINGSYWAGAILGSFASLIFLNVFAENVGWRLAFLMGPSWPWSSSWWHAPSPRAPRCLLTHGRVEEAEAELAKIEEAAVQKRPDARGGQGRQGDRAGAGKAIRLSWCIPYPRRAILGATLMITQSFLYNAIFFTYALVLTEFYGVSATAVPAYGLAFSVGNLIGPLVLAPLFDIVGRRAMISGTYLLPACCWGSVPSCSTTDRWTPRRRRLSGS